MWIGVWFLHILRKLSYVISSLIYYANVFVGIVCLAMFSLITLYLVMLISGDENLPDDVPVSLKQFCFVSCLLWSVLCLELAFK